jgi:putative endonuclease
MNERREDGDAGERLAEQHLRRLRYVIVERNYQCRGGEIDLIAMHQGFVVFVEVRRRAVGSLVHPFESVDGGKRRRIVTAARHYAVKNRLDDHPMRFDLVAVWDDGAELTCEVLENAFDLNDLPRYRPRW